MDSLTSYFQHFTYAAIFLGLLACGLGVPIPEEVFLIGSGLLVYGGYADYWLVTFTAMSSIMIGDSIAFWLGKYYADRIYRIPWIGKLMGSEKHLSWIQKHFDGHSFKTIFVARFLAGLRAPTFFFAGGHGVSYWRFFFANFLGALISVPTSIWIAWYLGKNQEEARRVVKEFHIGVLIVVAVAIGGFLIWYFWKKKKKKAVLSSGEQSSAQ